MSKTVTIIDTFGFFFRSFYALPQYLKNKDGFPTGLLTGFLNFISSLQREHDSDYLIFAIDSKGATFREEIYKEYKAHRTPPPNELLMQLPIAIEWIAKMGYKTLGQEGYEADDIIASVVHHAKEHNYNVRIVSHDKDLHQLIDDGKVVLVDAITKKVMDEEECYKKYGVTPKQFCDYQSMVGDSSDNIPGVKGIGKVGASKLLQEFKTLDNIYKNIDSIKLASTIKKLVEFRNDAYMSKKLVTLRDDIFRKFNFEEYKMDIPNPFLNIYDELVKYEQNAILRVLNAKEQVKEPQEIKKEDVLPLKKEGISFNVYTLTHIDELKRVLHNLGKDTIIAFDTETTGLDYEKDSLVGFSFCFDEKSAYYVPMAHSYLGVLEQISTKDAKEAIKEIFKHKVIGHNIKFDLHFVERFLQSDLEIYADSMILAWLIDTDSSLSLDKLSVAYLNHTMIAYKDVVKKNETFASVAIEDAAVYAAEDAYMTLKLYHILLEKLKLQGTTHLIDEFFEVEVPFIKTLLRMENAGIKLDTAVLEKFLYEAKELLAKLTKDIYRLSGSEFNINSTQQLGIVLFETLGLSTQKKTKTGYSTDENTLNALLDEHPVIEVLLEYREVYKLYSTYIEPLLKLASLSKDRRVHTSFIQSGTSTGRLSSKNPNLQNIPTRTPFGSKVREAFVASSGKVLVGIDYSQIELRLLAHFTQDSVLVDAFMNDKDIHRQTAVALFGEDEADAKRNIAKTVNFGLLYGMGQKKLSQTLGISTSEAKEIIGKYFNSFGSVRAYFSSIVEASKKDGFVETLLGRRRYFDYANASAMFKAAYEREAVNSVFQGSASDLIKLSMNKIDQIIIDENLDAKMLLQIHDELIFEVNERYALELGMRFQEIMQSIMKLNVPLKASLNIGKNWGELK